MNEVIRVGEIKILHVKKGDVVVCHIPASIPVEQYERIINGIEHIFENAGIYGLKYIALDNDLNLQIMRAEPIQEEPE